MHDQETPEQKAIRLLNRQLGELEIVRGLTYSDPKFKTWRDTTRGHLERFLGKENHHTYRFASTRFLSQVMRMDPFGGGLPPGYVSNEDRQEFQQGCSTAEETLRAAIREIEDFGVYVEEHKPSPNRRSRSGSGGGVSQNFHGPVSIQNLAIAADNAIQKIGQMGDQTHVQQKADVFSGNKPTRVKVSAL